MPISGFDTVADEYDRLFTHTMLGRNQRDVVWNQLEQIIKHSSGKPNVLDLNCGTGEDAIFLRGKGCLISAIDISSKMIKIAQAKCKERGINDINLSRRDIRNLHEYNPEDKYDLILSNFGGINCLSPDELKILSNDISFRLRPNGYVALVVMSDRCIVEKIYGLIKGDLNLSLRRQKSPQEVQLQSGDKITTWYYSPSQVRKHICQSNLRFINSKPIGFFPSYLNKVYSRQDWVGTFMRKIESTLIKFKLFSRWSDHYLISFSNMD